MSVLFPIQQSFPEVLNSGASKAFYAAIVVDKVHGQLRVSRVRTGQGLRTGAVIKSMLVYREGYLLFLNGSFLDGLMRIIYVHLNIGIL